jgi:hypothetical protein
MSLPFVHKIDKFRIYEVNDDYVKYLHSFENKVHLIDSKRYIVSVKYFGDIKNKGNFIYVMPLSSDKNRLYFNLDERTNTIEKLKSPGTVNHPSKYLGVIQIGSQIPIKLGSNLLKEYALDPNKSAYGQLLQYEKYWADKYKKDIYDKSINCLENKITYKEKMHCCNFKILEQAANVYDENNELVKERISAYPKVFSEEENKEFFNAIQQNIKNKQNQSGGSSGTPIEEDKNNKFKIDTSVSDKLLAEH